MEKINQKKALALSIVGVITLILVVVGATFAYFTAQTGDAGNINVNANTATTDNLSFQVGSAISLTANEEDFGQGTGNKSGSTFARATLTANNATNNATRNYYVYLSITNNDFEYTTDDEQAEILLKVTDPDGTEVTTISDLARKTSGGETGFDITTSKGLITIADNYEIVSTGTVTQEWQIEVIFANLDSDQNANTNKTFTANLIIQEGEIDNSLATYIASLHTINGENDLYYHDGTMKESYCTYNDNVVLSIINNGASISSEDCTQVFNFDRTYYDASALDEGIEEGKVEQISYDGTCKTATTSTDVTVDGYDSVDEADCSGYALIIDGIAVKLNEVGSGTMQEYSLDAGDNSYRYAGANPNNYVCFGSDAESCPADNLYRIIGVFDGEVKLIKADYANSNLLGEDGGYNASSTYSTSTYPDYHGSLETINRYYWNNNTNNNEWSESNLNTVNLNTNFYGTFEKEWQDKISLHSWKVGGSNRENISLSYTPVAYQYELGNNSCNTDSTDCIVSGNIGLMYVSDYGYAATPDYWYTYLGETIEEKNSNNWLYNGMYEWFITPANGSVSIFYLYRYGYTSDYIVTSYASAVRPVFYLKSDVTMLSGDGSEQNPFRILV